MMIPPSHVLLLLVSLRRAVRLLLLHGCLRASPTTLCFPGSFVLVRSADDDEFFILYFFVISPLSHSVALGSSTVELETAARLLRLSWVTTTLACSLQ